jgi:tRNA threonylcarbamoyl adenosine modification protein (Sua5/YciO/YrdC/YwlC family)
MHIITGPEYDFDIVAHSIRNGGTVVYPTETCYGLGCDAFNVAAVKKVFSIKEREPGKPVLVLVADAEQAQLYVAWSDALEKITRMHWPGPLTVVADARNPGLWPRDVIGPDGTIALRVSSHPIAGALVKKIKTPLVSTSANRSGQKNNYSPAEIFSTIGQDLLQPDILIDGGTLLVQPPSTIVRVCDSSVTVIRQGSIII